NDVLYDASPPDISNLSLHDALPIFLHVTSAPTRGQEAVVQDADLPLVLRIDEGPPACDILLEEIVAIANRVTIEELRHELELLLGLGVDPNLHQRPARHFIMPKRLRVREQIAGRLPRYDLVNGDGLEELGAPKRRVSIGISFVGVVVAVASRQPLGDHWREAGDLPRRFVSRSSL